MADKFPKQKFHATEAPRTVRTAKEEEELGPEWSDEYVYQAYPKVVYHLHGSNKTVKNDEEQAALGEGWYESPTAAQEAEDRLFQSMKVRELLAYSVDPGIVDKYFKKHFSAAKGEDKWTLVSQYNRHFPDVIVESPWAGKLLPNMPRDKDYREESSVKDGIFISHIGEEREIVLALQKWLRTAFGNELGVFASSDPESISSGADWHGQITSTVKRSRVVIVLCSPDSIDRPWINYEAGLGDGTDWDVSEVGSTYVTPVVIRGLSKGDLKAPLSRKQLRDIEDSNDAKAWFQDIGRFLKAPQTKIDFDTFTEEIRSLGKSIQAVSSVVVGNDDVGFETYAKRLLMDNKESEFSILVEDLRAAATDCWRITSTNAFDAGEFIDRIKKKELIPTLGRLTLLGVLLVKYEAPPAWLRKIFDALQSVFDVSNQLARTAEFQTIPYTEETTSLDSHRSTTVPALEALISFYTIGGYIQRRGASATMYLVEMTPRIVDVAVGRDDVYEPRRKPLLLWPISGKWGYPRVPRAKMVVDRYGSGRVADLAGGSDQLLKGTLELETIAEWHSYLALVPHPAPRMSKFLADRFPKVRFEYLGQFLSENPNKVMAVFVRLWEFAKAPTSGIGGIGLDKNVSVELASVADGERIDLVLSFFLYIEKEAATRLMQQGRSAFLINWPDDIAKAIQQSK